MTGRALQIGVRLVIAAAAVIILISCAAGGTPNRFEGIVLSTACALLALNPPLPPVRLSR